jgi:hypothetical protein
VVISCDDKKKDATPPAGAQMQQQIITADALIVATRPLSADIEIPVRSWQMKLLRSTLKYPDV